MPGDDKKVTLPLIRERVETNLKADCPSFAQLKSKGPEFVARCKYIGFSKTCADCTYDWSSIASGLIGIVDDMLSEKQNEKLHSSKSMSKRALLEMGANEGAQAAANLEVPAKKLREIAESMLALASESEEIAKRTHVRFQPFRDGLRAITPGYQEGAIGKPTAPLLVEASGESVDESKKRR